MFDIAENLPETNYSNGFARISSFTEHWFINSKGKNELGKTWELAPAHEICHAYRQGSIWVSSRMQKT